MGEVATIQLPREVRPGLGALASLRQETRRTGPETQENEGVNHEIYLVRETPEAHVQTFPLPRLRGP